MNTHDALRAEFDRLLAGLCDSQLTGDQFGRLEQLILQSPSLRLRYCTYTQLHVMAESAGQSAESSGRSATALAVVRIKPAPRMPWPLEGIGIGPLLDLGSGNLGPSESLDAEIPQVQAHPRVDLSAEEMAGTADHSDPSTATDSAASAMPASATTEDPRRSPLLGFLGTIAQRSVPWHWSAKALAIGVVSSLTIYFVGLMISIGLDRAGWGSAHPRVDENTLGRSPARITGTVRCRLPQHAGALEIGADLSGKSTRLTAGLLEIELAHGVRVCIEGPAEFEPLRPGCVQLTRGRLVAHVPKQGRGFKVDTPSAEIVDLGTEFGVEVDASGATQVQVFQGVVEMAATIRTPPGPAAGPQTVRRVLAGQTARVAAGAVRVESAPAAPGTFVREMSGIDLRDVAAHTEYADAVIERTHPVRYWSFDDGRGRSTRDLLKGEIFDYFDALEIGVNGPLPKDGFLRMAARNRAVRVGGSQVVACKELIAGEQVPIDAYSVQLWFNSSAPFGDQTANYLFGRANGTDWRVDQQDCVCVGGKFHADAVGHLRFWNGLDGDDLLSIPGPIPLQPNRWYHVTLVRDRSAVKLYLNGGLEVSVRSPWRGVAGNYLSFGHRPDLSKQFGLFGSFDEVAIWDYALDEQAVRWLFESACGEEHRPTAAAQEPN